MKNHNSATYYSLTGYAPPVDDIRLRDSPDLFPAYGSIVDKLAPAGGGMPTFVAYPHVLRDGSITPGQHASFLGKAHNPLFFSQDPNAPISACRSCNCRPTCRCERLETRRELLKLIDEQSKLLDDSATARGIDESYQRAVEHVDLAEGPAGVRPVRGTGRACRDRYGRTTYGQSLPAGPAAGRGGGEVRQRLLRVGDRRPQRRRRLGHARLRRQPDVPDPQGLPAADHRPDAADAAAGPEGPRPARHDAGRLDGRVRPQPADQQGRPAATIGRIATPRCWPAAASSAATSTAGRTRPGPSRPATSVRPDDLAATMFTLLGLDPATEIRDTLGRPFPIAKGTAVQGVIA